MSPVPPLSTWRVLNRIGRPFHPNCQGQSAVQHLFSDNSAIPTPRPSGALKTRPCLKLQKLALKRIRAVMTGRELGIFHLKVPASLGWVAFLRDEMTQRYKPALKRQRFEPRASFWLVWDLKLAESESTTLPKPIGSQALK